MLRISTYSRLSLGLAFLTLTAMSCAYLLDLIPDKGRFILSERQAISESLAVLCTKAAEKNDIETISATLKAFVERNDQILSAALRGADGTLLAVAGDHDLHWKGALAEKSDPTHVRVPIYQGSQNRIWGNMEVAFRPIYGKGLKRFLFDPVLQLFGFILLFGFFIYRVFLGKVLKQLDPTSVVPPRVRTALDTMVEGIVLLDNNARIILANESFGKIVAKFQNELIGKNIDGLHWEMPGAKTGGQKFPWTATLENGTRHSGVPLQAPDETGHRRTFMVNTSPIIDGHGRPRGVLATFDDVTLVEEKNEQLRAMLNKLKAYSEKIEAQNQKLDYLATRDSLTGCRNRRSMFDIFDKEFNSAKRYGHPISCIMFDIDHFKVINDTHGHAAGDNVLREIASVIGGSVREMDTVGRYGGEEFCIILPHIDLEKAQLAAERFRAAIEAHDFSGISVTASFGVASIEAGAKDPSALINQSDNALYKAKESGRNRVTAWQPTEPAPQAEPSDTPAHIQRTQTRKNKSSDTGHLTTQAATDVPLRRLEAEPALQETSEKSEDRLEALLMVHTSLTESAQKSEAMGLHAAMTQNDLTAVQLNKADEWGDVPDRKKKQGTRDTRSISQVAKLLQKNAPSE